ALLLNGRVEEALPYWRQLGRQPSHQAALLVCLVALDQPLPTFPHELAPRLNQEFLVWYRRLLAAQAGTLIRRLNERLDVLRVASPAAAQAVQAALAEATAETAP